MLTILFHLALLFTPSFGFGLGSTYDQFLSDLLKWWGVDHCVIDFVYDDDKAGISNEIIAALSDRCEQIRKFIVQKLLLTLYLSFRHKVIIRRICSVDLTFFRFYKDKPHSTLPKNVPMKSLFYLRYLGYRL